MLILYKFIYMVVYDKLSNYEKYKSTYCNFKEVKETRTKYSIKIDFGKRKVFLNKDGNDTNLLKLISLVKKDANNYLNGKKIEKINSYDIFWYLHNELYNDNGKKFEVAKIDLKSAYWSKAQNFGVISKETVDYFESLKFSSIKEKKHARLKALGSLATVKSQTSYSYGKQSREFKKTIFNESYRNIYMSICNSVAKDMQTVLSNVNGIYYYWDCIFVAPEYINEVGRLFNILGYNFTVEKDIAEIFKSKYISYLYCSKTGIKYPLN